MGYFSPPLLQRVVSPALNRAFKTEGLIGGEEYLMGLELSRPRALWGRFFKGLCHVLGVFLCLVFFLHAGAAFLRVLDVPERILFLEALFCASSALAVLAVRRGFAKGAAFAGLAAVALEGYLIFAYLDYPSFPVDSYVPAVVWLAAALPFVLAVRSAFLWVLWIYGATAAVFLAAGDLWLPEGVLTLPGLAFLAAAAHAGILFLSELFFRRFPCSSALSEHVLRASLAVSATGLLMYAAPRFPAAGAGALLVFSSAGGVLYFFLRRRPAAFPVFFLSVFATLSVFFVLHGFFLSRDAFPFEVLAPLGGLWFSVPLLAAARLLGRRRP